MAVVLSTLIEAIRARDLQDRALVDEVLANGVPGARRGPFERCPQPGLATVDALITRT
jgi:hypothetical protein